MLENIYIIRHGESVGNVNKAIYKSVPDHAVHLTKKGVAQCENAGEILSKYILSSKLNEANELGIYYSPFVRTIQTTNLILKKFKESEISPKFVYENALIREQEWQSRFGEESTMSLTGLNSSVSKDRINFGIFFYRFDSGESCADVYDRCKSFINEINFNSKSLPRNLIVVTHGMTMRVLLMVMCNKTVKEFESWNKPDNCEIWKVQRYCDGDFNSKFVFDFSKIKIRDVKNTHQVDITL